MSFNTAISGIQAANKRLEVAGNNIANVGTLGFKSSRAQFSALYASAQLGPGSTLSGMAYDLLRCSRISIRVKP
ncbi:flagellar basal body protein [Pseudomonas cerasi]|uniref:Flagellar basal body rod protein N-terminal domain-containing protein n=1 Tax=Pseudomonas cerasi TaxID=1583341 RepID=A0A193SMI2_9PSED|nr:flagellar basal body protein [Pseudomonas cerasi]CZT28274.1 hypothetical protein PCPL58_1818 [Pseudomonas cerasi]SOS18401.1 hypothetical protein PL963_01859 [Pseudomonas cerasi]